MADKRGRGFVEQRRQTILNILREKGRVNVADLAEKLGISSLTVRRDLDELESRGQVTRRYGEALLADGAGIQKAADPFEAAKERIGRAAAELVEDREQLFVNTSSTALGAIKYLDARGVTVITNSLRGQELPVPEGGMVLVTGGEVRPPEACSPASSRCRTSAASPRAPASWAVPASALPAASRRFSRQLKICRPAALKLKYRRRVLLLWGCPWCAKKDGRF